MGARVPPFMARAILKVPTKPTRRVWRLSQVSVFVVLINSLIAKKGINANKIVSSL